MKIWLKFAVFALVLLAANAVSAEPAPESNFTYSTYENEITITGYTGAGGDVEIPAAISGVPVKIIGTDAFLNKTSLTGIIIPEGVETIQKAFGGCTNLERLTIPSTVTSIWSDVESMPTGPPVYYFAFDSCPNIQTLTINTAAVETDNWRAAKEKLLTVNFGANVESYSSLEDFTSLQAITAAAGNSVFAADSGILYNADKTELIFCPRAKVGKVTIPDTVKTIKEDAFNDCPNVTSIAFGSGMKTVTGFNNAAALVSVTFGDGVETIDGFNNAAKLTSVAFDNGVKTIKGFDNADALTGVSFGNSVEKIDGFHELDSLVSVTIPDNVTDIGDSFYKCTALKTLTVGTGVTVYSEQHSYGGAVPGVYNAYAFEASPAIESLNIKSQAVLGDAGRCFTGITENLKTLEIGGNATSVGTMFSGCTALTSVTLGKNVTEITGNAFYYCDKIKTITINSDATAAYDWSSAKQSLETVNIGDSIGTFPSASFIGYSVLSAFNADENNTAYSDIGGVLFNKEKTTLVKYPCVLQGAYEIPDGVVTVADGAFAETSGLTAVTIPESARNIGNQSFVSCANLASVTFDAGLTHIGEQAFYECSALANISVPNSVYSIGNEAFHETPWLTSRPNGVVYAGRTAYTFKGNMNPDFVLTLLPTTIGIADGAFANKTELAGINLPANLIRIGGSAFYNCTGIAGITVPDNVTEIGGRAFYSCSAISSVKFGTVEKTVTDVEEFAFFDGVSIAELILNSNAAAGYDWSGSIQGLQKLVIGDDVTEIGEGAFKNYESLLSVTLGNSLEAIAADAFEGVVNLERLSLDSDSAAEYDWSGISGSVIYLKIGSGVENIPDGTFDEFAAVETLDLNSGTASTAIWDSLKSDLKTVSFGGNVTEIGAEAFKGFASLTSVSIGENVISIGAGAFEGTALISISIPANVITIGGGAFSNCAAFTSITVHTDNQHYAAVDGILFNADKTGLLQYPGGKAGSEYTVPETVTLIGAKSFSGAKLTDVTVPKNVTEIAADAFESWSELMIYGYRNSAAQAFAAENEIPFTVLDPEPVIPDPGAHDESVPINAAFSSDDIEVIETSAVKLPADTEMIVSYNPNDAKKEVSIDVVSQTGELPPNVYIYISGGQYISRSESSTITIPVGNFTPGTRIFIWDANYTPLTMPINVGDVVQSRD